MSDTVISVENLSKSYLIGHDGPQERYHSLRDTVVRHGKNYARKAMDMARGRQIIQGDSVEEFWALKDVSFDVKRGEVLGIIGRNGAGKSTLLKILSRITEPTSGRVVLNGRVASLLEVGTGFHPELTGRENIFLNGAILGMTKVEIRSKFDEIVDFAEVEKFLDTPVKRYSSGMYVRLAFAVAAHLEPEILIVDEVLAVGDTQFQQKCLGKMQDVAKGGRTVLFVSHNMAAVKSLCNTSVILNFGKVAFIGLSDQGVVQYQNTRIAHKTSLSSIFISAERDLKVLEIMINGETHSPIQVDETQSVLNVSIIVEMAASRMLDLEAYILDQTGNCLASFLPGHRSGGSTYRTSGVTCLKYGIKLPTKMNKGDYCLNLSLTHHNVTSYGQAENLPLLVHGHPTDSGVVLEYSKGKGLFVMDQV